MLCAVFVFAFAPTEYTTYATLDKLDPEYRRIRNIGGSGGECGCSLPFAADVRVVLLR